MSCLAMSSVCSACRSKEKRSQAVAAKVKDLDLSSDAEAETVKKMVDSARKGILRVVLWLLSCSCVSLSCDQNLHPALQRRLLVKRLQRSCLALHSRACLAHVSCILVCCVSGSLQCSESCSEAVRVPRRMPS